MADELIRTGQLGGGNDLFVRRVQPAVADVLHHGAGEQVGVLQNDAQAAAQVVPLDLVHVNAVVADLAVGHVVEAVQQVGNGGFAGAGGAHKGDLLAGAGKQAHVMQHGLFRHIAEVQMLHPDVALHLHQHGLVVAVGNLPGPGAGALGHLFQLAVLGFTGVHQGDKAAVLLAGFVHHGEHALGAGQRHDDAVQLLRHLADGLVETAVELQEAGQLAQRQAAEARNGHAGAANGHHHVAEVAQVHVDGAHQVAQAVGLGGRLIQLLVQLGEGFHVLFLVAEHLNHLLAVHHLLDEAVHLAQILLLGGEVSGAGTGHGFGDEQHQAHHQQVQNGQGHAEQQHADQHAHHRDHAGDHLGDGLADHLAQGVHIVGVQAHDVAVGVAVKVAQGQAFHVGEQVVTDALQGALAHRDHHHLVGAGAHNAQGVPAHHLHHGVAQRGKVRVGLADHWQNVAVDQGLGEHGALHHGQAGAQDTNHDQQALGAVVVQHNVQQARHHLAGVLHFGAALAHHSAPAAGAAHGSCIGCHQASPPSWSSGRICDR